MGAKSDDESLSTMKIYNYFSFVFSTVPKNVELLKLLRKSLPSCNNGREEDNKFFVQFLLHPAVFQKTKYQASCCSFGSCQLKLPDQLPSDWVKISALENYQYYSGYLLAS